MTGGSRTTLWAPRTWTLPSWSSASEYNTQSLESLLSSALSFFSNALSLLSDKQFIYLTTFQVLIMNTMEVSPT